MEKLPKNSSDYLQKLNDSLGVVIFAVIIPERVIEYVNSAIGTVFGYKPDECIGKKTEIFYPAVEGYQDFGRSLKSAIKEGKDVLRVEGLFKRKNGEIFPCEVTTTFLKENKKIVRGISILQDVTDRKKAEEQNKTILRTALDGFWIVDIQGMILEVNDAYCNLIGYSHEELLKMRISDVEALESSDDIKKHIQQIIKAGSDRFESKHRCKDGRIIDVEVSINYMNIKGGCLFGFIRDITEQKMAEKTLHEQKKTLEQKNIALSEILGQIEIEKKQIKDNVIANAEKLLLPIIQKLKLEGESRKYVQLLRKNLQELTSSFGKKLTEKESRLTSREIEICNMIKNGITSKEIASLLNISLGTIEKHRNNIRRKLDIVNKDINLSSVLKTL